MTDDEFRQLAWRTLIGRVEALTLAIRAAGNFPMTESDALAMHGALGDLDEARALFESAVPYRLAQTGWPANRLSWGS